MELPTLTNEPYHYPGCCLSLSNQFVDQLSQLLISEVEFGLVLSIGSGTGLLEALLHDRLCERQGHHLRIEGVEVPSVSESLNYYLPEELSNTVDGTWAICDRAQTASALMFVYPRTTTLIEQYIRSNVQSGSSTHTIVWLGPKADWEDAVRSLRIPEVAAIEIIDDCNLCEYETLAVLKLKSTSVFE